MKLALATLAVIALSGAVSFAAAPPPPGATAQCRDGTYSFSQHHSGTCSHHGGVTRWLDGSTAPTPMASSGSTNPVNAPAPSLGRVVLLKVRTQTTGCTRGVLPDRDCSPGAFYSGLTKAVICSPTFSTSTIRNVPESEKYAVEREYGMPAKSYGRTIEIDHIVSLELGGANDIANLYPEPGSGVANYHVKDKLENQLHAMICADRMTLAAVRRGIATNWKLLYKRVFGSPP